jgi:hypothetical protein
MSEGINDLTIGALNFGAMVVMSSLRRQKLTGNATIGQNEMDG